MATVALPPAVGLGRGPRSRRRLVAGWMLLACMVLAPIVMLVGGWAVLVVRSDSMRPALAAGDLIVIRRLPLRAVKPGDIATFREPSQPGVLITHRVVQATRQGDRYALVTRGDANTGEERWSIESGDPLGRLVVRVPKVGLVASWLAPPPVRLLCLLGASLLLGFGWLARPGRRRERQWARRCRQTRAGYLRVRSWKHRVLAVTVGLWALGIVAGTGAYAAFTGSASESHSLSTGTVTLTDNDSDSAMLSLPDAKPGDTATGCIQVSYTGSIPANVRLYGSATGTGLGTYLDLTITRGTISSGAFPSCANFTSDSATYAAANGVVYSGTLANFTSTYPSYSSGLIDPMAGSPATWTNATTRAYRFTVTLQDNSSAQGLNTTQTVTWEARQA